MRVRPRWTPRFQHELQCDNGNTDGMSPSWHSAPIAMTRNTNCKTACASAGSTLWAILLGVYSCRRCCSCYTGNFLMVLAGIFCSTGGKGHVSCTTEDFATPTVCKQHLTTGCGCIREFFDRKNGIRLTFIWVITAGEGSFYLDSLIGQDNAPDLFITSKGAWDTLNGVPA